MRKMKQKYRKVLTDKKTHGILLNVADEQRRTKSKIKKVFRRCLQTLQNVYNR